MSDNSVQELSETVRQAITHHRWIGTGTGAIWDGASEALDRLLEIAGERDAALAAQAELQEELEEERTPPNGWGPAQEAWHQFHLDQTAAAEARAVAAEKERDGNERLYKSIQKVYLQTYSELEEARAQVAALTEALEPFAARCCVHKWGPLFAVKTEEEARAACDPCRARSALAGSPANTENE